MKLNNFNRNQSMDIEEFKKLYCYLINTINTRKKNIIFNENVKFIELFNIQHEWNNKRVYNVTLIDDATVDYQVLNLFIEGTEDCVEIEFNDVSSIDYKDDVITIKNGYTHWDEVITLTLTDNI